MIEVSAKFITVLSTHTVEDVRKVLIAFNKEEFSIDVTIYGNKKRFRIEADEARTFLAHGEKEISADDFSKHALEEVLFKDLKQR